jgi:two-component system, NtrC family, sensor kinase
MAVSAEAAHVESPPESETTLRTIVELVRRIMQADVAGMVSFSMDDETITWRAISGFRAHTLADLHTFIHPQASGIVKQALADKTVGILQGIGTGGEFRAEDFPVTAAEGVSDLAMAPLRIQAGQSGALIAGYRSPHNFTDDEKRILLDLAEMAAVSLANSQLADTVSTAERIWEQTFDAIREGIIVHDKEGRIVRSNELAAEMMNLQPSEVAGLSFNEAFSLLFGRRAADFHLKEEREENSSFEVQTEGDRRYLVSTFPINRPDGESFSVVTWNDVTRLSEMQGQLGRTRRLASVGQLAAGVAHEINNPLAAITTCAEATMRDLRQTPEVEELADSHQWKYYMEEIVRQALRCKEITRGLLDLTHQKQAKRLMCDVNAVAAQCAKVQLQRANSDTVEFEVKLDQSVGEVATDEAIVRQIIDNFLSNAIDALGDSRGKVKVTTIRDGDRVAIEVADTGSGIASDVLPSIFDPFFSTKGPGKGYGLGLAISATLAESLGGAITVESKEGAGSRFRLWIPRRAPEE